MIPRTPTFCGMVFCLITVTIAFSKPVAADAFADLRPGGNGRVVKIVDGDTLVLASGEEIRLVGIQAPKLPLGRRGFKKWPLAGEARNKLTELTLEKRVQLAFGGRRQDRHGRTLAHLFVLPADSPASGRKAFRPDAWVQGAMLRAGMARVYSFADNRALVAEMLSREANARGPDAAQSDGSRTSGPRTRAAAPRGIWRHPYYHVLSPTTAAAQIGRFALVSGKVHVVAQIRGRAYINFGADWRQDFTIAIDKTALRRFTAAGFPLATLAGRQIRVRGWLKRYNGPLINASHPEQIEVIE